MNLCFAVDVAEETAGLRAGDPPPGVDPHAGHRRHVQHQCAVRCRQPGDVVPAPFHAEQQIVLARELDGRDDVGGADAADDEPGPAIDHRVPERPRILVAGFFRQDHGAAQACAQLSEMLGREGQLPPFCGCHRHGAIRMDFDGCQAA